MVRRIRISSCPPGIRLAPPLDRFTDRFSAGLGAAFRRADGRRLSSRRRRSAERRVGGRSAAADPHRPRLQPAAGLSRHSVPHRDRKSALHGGVVGQRRLHDPRGARAVRPRHRGAEGRRRRRARRPRRALRRVRRLQRQHPHRRERPGMALRLRAAGGLSLAAAARRAGAVRRAPTGRLRLSRQRHRAPLEADRLRRAREHVHHGRRALQHLHGAPAHQRLARPAPLSAIGLSIRRLALRRRRARPAPARCRALRHRGAQYDRVRLVDAP